MNPGDSSLEPTAEIDRRTMERLPSGRGPQVQMVAITVTAMAVVATECHVHREATTTLGPGFMQGTAAIPLLARPTGGLEPQQVQHLFHRDLSTQPLEVDAWHVPSPLDEGLPEMEGRSVPFL